MIKKIDHLRAARAKLRRISKEINESNNAIETHVLKYMEIVDRYREKHEEQKRLIQIVGSPGARERIKVLDDAQIRLIQLIEQAQKIVDNLGSASMASIDAHPNPNIRLFLDEWEVRSDLDRLLRNLLDLLTQKYVPRKIKDQKEWRAELQIRSRCRRATKRQGKIEYVAKNK